MLRATRGQAKQRRLLAQPYAAACLLPCLAENAAAGQSHTPLLDLVSRLPFDLKLSKQH